MIVPYEVLTVQPDFTENPTYGIEDERETVNSPGGGSFAAWNGKTDRTFSFDFQLFSAEEWRNLREFFDRMGGRAGAFYLPSWQHDFELAKDVPAGETQICVSGHWHSENMVENRPDTLGRVIFTVNHLGQFSTHYVVSIGEDGENDLLLLNRPILSAMEAGRTVVGFCYLSRLVNDTIETFHPSPDDARASLSFREITQTRRVNQREAAASDDILTLKGNEDIIATDEDPILQDSYVYETLGPLSRGVPQADNFQTSWTAALDLQTNQLTLRRSGFSTTTPLYSAPGVADKIALAFDGSSREVIAWELDGRVWLAWNQNSQTAQENFPGISPLLYSTFSIDGLVDAGSATLAVFYLKEKDSTIYCRTLVESFATEHRFLISPLAPLSLFRARKFESRIELVGMDAGHRLTRWRSEVYQTPLPIDFVTSTIESLTGEYRELRVVSRLEETSMIDAAFELTGRYRSTLQQSLDNRAPGMDANGVQLTGRYRSTREQSLDNRAPGMKALAVTLSGTYTETRVRSEATDGAMNAHAVTLSGTYQPPL